MVIYMEGDCTVLHKTVEVQTELSLTQICRRFCCLCCFHPVFLVSINTIRRLNSVPKGKYVNLFDRVRFQCVHLITVKWDCQADKRTDTVTNVACA